MEISEADWNGVVAAYEVGRAMESNHGKAIKDLYGHAINEDRVRADLQRLARCLDKCSDATLRVLDAHQHGSLFPSGYLKAIAEGQLQYGYFASGTFTRHVAEVQNLMIQPNEGRSAPLRHQFAVRLLCHLWPNKIELGRRKPYFNPLVQWLGQQLSRLDQSLSGPDDVEEADTAAYNALKAKLQSDRGYSS